MWKRAYYNKMHKLGMNKWLIICNGKYKNKLNLAMCERERHDKAYYKTSTKMSIEHQHSLH